MAYVPTNIYMPGGSQPDLTKFDLILLNTSGGKDSQTMMRVVCAEAKRTGVLDRVVAVHADLGRVEWQGTKDLAATQAAHYGLRFELVKRNQGDLLDHIEARGMFPGPATRYCTSDHKTSQVYRVMTRLVAERRLYRPMRILNCLGLRAEESAKRAKDLPYSWNKYASNKTKRHVWNWLPIHGWTETEVWQDIRTHDVPHHWAYDRGMPRLSCCFCVYATKEYLMLAAQLNPGLAAEYVEVEARIGHNFQEHLTVAEVVEDAKTAEITSIGNWAA